MKYVKWGTGVIVAVLLVSLLVYGCTPRTASLLHEGETVTRKEFQAEVAKIQKDQAYMLERVEAGGAELTAQELRNAEMLQTAADIAGGAVNMALTGQATATSVVGLGIMGALGGAWQVAKRRANKGDAVGGVVVKAVDVIRKNPAMEKSFESALKTALIESGMSEAEYTKAIAQLKAGNV